MNTHRLSLSIRSLQVEDEPTLWTMLGYAAHESSLTAVKENPDLSRYVLGWGRVGDLGVVAEQKGHVIGSAWVRLWESSNRGYGYISDEIPELAIAVIPRERGKGIGTALLISTLELAQSKFSAVCLSIREDNPALRLYERTGFVQVAGSEVTNRAGGVSFKMLRKFEE